MADAAGLQTDAGNLSAYIPTNLISITDGQIALDAKLFYQGQKPAVDVGTSVSRVGGKTQAVALRDAAKTLRLDYAQFLELESFTRFSGMPDTRVQQQLTRGACIRPGSGIEARTRRPLLHHSVPTRSSYVRPSVIIFCSLTDRPLCAVGSVNLSRLSRRAMSSYLKVPVAIPALLIG